MPLWESDCTKRLEIIRDVPPGKCIYWFERTDMVRAFEVLGDVTALRGNLSPSMMTTGKPHEVELLRPTPLRTVGDVLGHLTCTHIAFHLAQLSACRRKAGKAPVV